MTPIHEFLALIGHIARSYATQHCPEVLDPDDHDWVLVIRGQNSTEENYTIGEFNHWLQGWWVLDDTAGWEWWLCVFDKCPADKLVESRDLIDFPYCRLDAPLPNADFTEFGVVSRHSSLAEVGATS